MSQILLSDAIVLRRRRLGEADLAADLLAQSGQRLCVRGHGLAATRRRSALLLEPGALVRLHYYARSSETLQSIKEGQVLEAFAEWKGDYASMTMLAHLLEVADIAADGEAQPARYQLLLGALRSRPDTPQTALAIEDRRAAGLWLCAFFKLRTLKLSGLLGDLQHCSQCGAALGDDACWNLPEAFFSCARCHPDANRDGARSARLLHAMATQRFGDFLAACRQSGMEMRAEDGLLRSLDAGLHRCLEQGFGRPLKTRPETD
ncbi:MAG: DNA repair protein RecO [Leptospirales bacterium]|nr:DNA repair protein RecO [Leptospirales bacterium]